MYKMNTKRVANLILTLISMVLIILLAMIIVTREDQVTIQTIQSQLCTTQNQLKDSQKESTALREKYDTLAKADTQTLNLELLMAQAGNSFKFKYEASQQEIEVMAQIIWAEASGLPKYKQAAVAWCILNRVDQNINGDTILEVATYPEAFAYYSSTPIRKDMEELAEDVLLRWNLEKCGFITVGRTLPSGYLFFWGDGADNYYTKDYHGRNYWDWDLPDPYLI